MNHEPSHLLELLWEYEDNQGRWYNINPLLLETEKYRAIAHSNQ